MATSLPQLLFVATIATVLALSASPAAAQQPGGSSMLVKTLCSMRGGQYSAICYKVLNNQLGNSASNYQDLLNMLLRATAVQCEEIFNDFTTYLPTEFGQANAQVFKTCINKFNEAKQQFAAMATLDPGHKYAAFYNLERNFVQASDCEAALKKDSVTSSSSTISGKIYSMKMYTSIANDAIILIKKQEQTGGNGGEF